MKIRQVNHEKILKKKQHQGSTGEAGARCNKETNGGVAMCPCCQLPLFPLLTTHRRKRNRRKAQEHNKTRQHMEILKCFFLISTIQSQKLVDLITSSNLSSMQFYYMKKD
jgi:hypothetical protein